MNVDMRTRCAGDVGGERCCIATQDAALQRTLGDLNGATMFLTLSQTGEMVIQLPGALTRVREMC